jgi:lipopolysaccharide export system protein LptA
MPYFLLFVPFSLFGFEASAQGITDGFAAFSVDRNEPIHIEANELEVFDDKKIAVFSGDVRARQGKFTLKSQRLEVQYKNANGADKSNAAGGQISTIKASQNVAIVTADKQSATSQWAVFDVNTQLVTLGNEVILSQDKNILKGNKLIIDLKTGRSKFHTDSRIRGLFMPGEGRATLDTMQNPDKPEQENNKLPPNGNPLPWNDSQQQ